MMPILYENLSKIQADLCGLVLSSSNIPFRLAKDIKGFNVWVGEDTYCRALVCMQSYFNENKEMPSFPDKRVSVTMGSVVSSNLAAFVLMVFHAEIAKTNSEEVIIQKFGSSAQDIIHGELYRIITSLMLHSDILHLVGNMVGICVFATAVCAVCGWGVGLLMILMSGAIGNWINAAMYESGHISIGASTAVFGAIGILSGYQLIKSQKFHRRRFAAWAPLACGLALLGLLGSASQSDITAHFFGFAVGIGMGLLYAMFFHFPLKNFLQVISIGIVFFFIMMAWMVGW